MRSELWMEIRNDRLKGLSYVNIAKKYNIDRRTAKKYALDHKKPSYVYKNPRKRKIDAYTLYIDELKLELQETETMLSNLIDTRVKTPDFSESLFMSKYNEYSNKMNLLSKEISRLELEHVKTFDTQQRLDTINTMLKNKDLVIDTLDSDILRSFIYKMISVSPEEVVFCVAGTQNYSDAEFAVNRKKFLKLEPIYEGHYIDTKYDKHMNYRVIII